MVKKFPGERFYLPKFQDWVDQFKILNPIEYDAIFKKVYYNNNKDVLWLEFKSVKVDSASEENFNVCITEPDNADNHFGFYFAHATSKVQLPECYLYTDLYCKELTEKDIERLNFLTEIGLIKFIYYNRFNSTIIFTLTKRTLKNGSV